MSEPTIAPSAQRLAEENNVNWRTLRGSGDGGSVVEHDVLTYLARVMRGEEATDPTPEPVPEGMSAWPEEAERRPGAPPTAAPSSVPFAEPFAVPDAPPSPKDEPVSPWTFAAPETAVQAEAEAPAADGSAGLPVAVQGAPPGEGVSEAAHQAALAELATLKERLESLEKERRRHVDELHQLSRMQETIALQKTENAKLGALRSEADGLREELAQAQGEAEREARRAEALAAQNRDLEGRLERARAFKEEAKTEFDTLTTRNAALEAQLAALKRPWWKFWG